MKLSIIFDFDGVLADSFNELYEMNKKAMELMGEKFTQENYRDLFLGNVHDQLNKKIPQKKLKIQFDQFKNKNFSKYYKGVQLFPHAKKIINALEPKASLSIVSSTPKRLIIRLLKKQGLEKQFKTIHGSKATSKKNELTHAVRSMKSKFENTHFITDSVGDIKIGHELKLITCAVAWGFNNKNQLQQQQPNYFFNKPDNILSFFSKL